MTLIGTQNLMKGWYLMDLGALICELGVQYFAMKNIWFNDLDPESKRVISDQSVQRLTEQSKQWILEGYGAEVDQKLLKACI